MINANAGIAIFAFVLVVISWEGCGFSWTNDVSTDTDHPPEFASAIPMHSEGSRKRPTAYPDIRPLAVDLPPLRAYDAALSAAKRMNWQIVEGDPARGRIEAVAATRWLGFKDDVVIRISPASGGSVIDVRSASRIGKSDFGANARRIRSFLKTLADAAKEVR